MAAKKREKRRSEATGDRKSEVRCKLLCIGRLHNIKVLKKEPSKTPAVAYTEMQFCSLETRIIRVTYLAQRGRRSTALKQFPRCVLADKLELLKSCVYRYFSVKKCYLQHVRSHIHETMYIRRKRSEAFTNRCLQKKSSSKKPILRIRIVYIVQWQFSYFYLFLSLQTHSSITTMLSKRSISGFISLRSTLQNQYSRKVGVKCKFQSSSSDANLSEHSSTSDFPLQLNFYLNFWDLLWRSALLVCVKSSKRSLATELELRNSNWRFF